MDPQISCVLRNFWRPRLVNPDVGFFFGLLLLPFLLLGLAFAVVVLPLLFLRFVLKLVFGLLLLPLAVILLLAMLVAGLAIAFAIAIPLVPVLLLFVCAWAIARLVFRPAVSAF